MKTFIALVINSLLCVNTCRMFLVECSHYSLVIRKPRKSLRGGKKKWVDCRGGQLSFSEASFNDFAVGLTVPFDAPLLQQGI
jgi:hypothetical protein